MTGGELLARIGEQDARAGWLGGGELLRINYIPVTYPYRYAWKNNTKRLTLYGRRLRVLFRAGPNSCAVEFENGQCEVISRNALRKHYVPLRAAMP